tara:strand:- start:6398 stop:6790 length:393 start_codon:yes stop_codon:yes gene_type:complete
MAVTEAQIRDLLNRPRGLNSGTITEYITMRTNQVNKVARSSTLYGVASGSAVSDDNKDDAVKALVCLDCLQVLIDTAPSFVPENEFRQQDIRFNQQIAQFRRMAQSFISLIEEAGGSAFHIVSTSTGLSS